MQRQTPATGIDRFRSRMQGKAPLPGTGPAAVPSSKQVGGSSRSPSAGQQPQMVKDAAKTQKREDPGTQPSNLMKRMAKKKYLMGQMYEDELPAEKAAAKQECTESNNVDDKITPPSVT
jgi:hypothetical protein